MLKEILRKSALFLFKIFDQNKSRGKSKILCQLLFFLEPGIWALNNLAWFCTVMALVGSRDKALYYQNVLVLFFN